MNALSLKGDGAYGTSIIFYSINYRPTYGARALLGRTSTLPSVHGEDSRLY